VELVVEISLEIGKASERAYFLQNKKLGFFLPK